MLRGNSGIALQPLEHDVQMAVAPALFFLAFEVHVTSRGRCWLQRTLPSGRRAPIAAGFSVLFQVAEGHRLPEMFK